MLDPSLHGLRGRAVWQPPQEPEARSKSIYVLDVGRHNVKRQGLHSRMSGRVGLGHLLSVH